MTDACNSIKLTTMHVQNKNRHNKCQNLGYSSNFVITIKKATMPTKKKQMAYRKSSDKGHKQI